MGPAGILEKVWATQGVERKNESGASLPGSCPFPKIGQSVSRPFFPGPSRWWATRAHATQPRRMRRKPLFLSFFPRHTSLLRTKTTYSRPVDPFLLFHLLTPQVQSAGALPRTKRARFGRLLLQFSRFLATSGAGRTRSDRV